MLNFLSPIITTIGNIVSKAIPDKDLAAKMQADILKMQHDEEMQKLNADFNLAIQQLAVNKAEAESDGIFKGGWRPFVGWVCGIALSCNYVLRPLLEYFSTLLGYPIILPQLDLAELIPLLMGMLGLVGYRTYEKIKGV